MSTILHRAGGYPKIEQHGHLIAPPFNPSDFATNCPGTQKKRRTMQDPHVNIAKFIALDKRDAFCRAEMWNLIEDALSGEDVSRDFPVELWPANTADRSRRVYTIAPPQEISFTF